MRNVRLALICQKFIYGSTAITVVAFAAGGSAVAFPYGPARRTARRINRLRAIASRICRQQLLPVRYWQAIASCVSGAHFAALIDASSRRNNVIQTCGRRRSGDHARRRNDIGTAVKRPGLLAGHGYRRDYFSGEGGDVSSANIAGTPAAKKRPRLLKFTRRMPRMQQHRSLRGIACMMSERDSIIILTLMHFITLRCFIMK